MCIGATYAYARPFLYMLHLHRTIHKSFSFKVPIFPLGHYGLDFPLHVPIFISSVSICVFYWDTLHHDSCTGVWARALSSKLSSTAFLALISPLLCNISKSDVRFLTKKNNIHCYFELHLKDNESALLLLSWEVYSFTILSTHYVLTVDTDLTEFETVNVVNGNSFILDSAVKQIKTG